MRHYIITRFASWKCADVTIDVFSEEYLRTSFVKLQNAIIKTLENQTNKSFTLIINIHNDVSSEKIAFLYDIKADFDIKVLRTNEISQFILDDSSDEKCVVISRLDIDDFIRNDAVELMQQKVQTSKKKYVLSGLYNGATMTYDNKEVYFLPVQPYVRNKQGAFSTLITLGFNNGAHIEYLKQNMERGPVNYDHTKCFFDFGRKAGRNNCEISFIRSDDRDPLYLWTGYGDNGTVHIRESRTMDTTWHKSNILLDIDFGKYMRK